MSPLHLRVVRPLTYAECIALGCTESEADDYVEAVKATLVIHLDAERVLREAEEAEE